MEQLRCLQRNIYVALSRIVSFATPHRKLPDHPNLRYFNIVKNVLRTTPTEQKSGNAADQPPTTGPDRGQGPNFSPGRVGFGFSLLSICGVAVVGPFGDYFALAGIALASLAIPGVLLSVIGLWFAPRRRAVWGLALGIIASLYSPTFWLSLMYCVR